MDKNILNKELMELDIDFNKADGLTKEDIKKLFTTMNLGEDGKTIEELVFNMGDKEFRNVFPFLRETISENLTNETYKQGILSNFDINSLQSLHEMNIFIANDIVPAIMGSKEFSEEKKMLLAQIFTEPTFQAEEIIKNKFFSKNPINVKILVKEGGEIPTYAHDTDAGCDVYASEDTILLPNSFGNKVNTNIAVATPIGHECRVSLRSGTAMKTKVRLSNGIGVVDTNYRGNIGILLDNFDNVPYEIKKGDRIAQLVFAPVAFANFIQVDDLEETDRGEGGFGSSGK